MQHIAGDQAVLPAITKEPLSLQEACVAVLQGVFQRNPFQLDIIHLPVTSHDPRKSFP